MERHAEFQTAKASQYLASLCQHFGRKVPAKNNGTSGKITFPFGECALRADDAHLELSATAESQANLEKTVEVVTNHLERFAFRENPRIEWQTADPTSADAG